MTEIEKNRLREYLRLTASLQRAMEETTLRVEGSDNIWHYTGYKQFARKYVTILDFINSEISLPQLYVIYDLGHIRDQIEFRHDFEKAPSVSVIVIKY